MKERFSIIDFEDLEEIEVVTTPGSGSVMCC